MSEEFRARIALALRRKFLQNVTIFKNSPADDTPSTTILLVTLVANLLVVLMTRTTFARLLPSPPFPLY